MSTAGKFEHRETRKRGVKGDTTRCDETNRQDHSHANFNGLSTDFHCDTVEMGTNHAFYPRFDRKTGGNDAKMRKTVAETSGNLPIYSKAKLS